MNSTALDLLGGLDDPERARLLEPLVGDGPDLSLLLVELARMARKQGKTRLSGNLYNSAIYQEEARGRPGSELALEGLKALAEIELKIGEPGIAAHWARRLRLAATSDLTLKTADRLIARASRETVTDCATGGTTPRDANRGGSIDARYRGQKLRPPAADGDAPKAAMRRSPRWLVDVIAEGGPELGELLLSAARRLREDGDLAAANRYAELTCSLEEGRGQSASPAFIGAIRMQAELAFKRDELDRAHFLVTRIKRLPDRDANVFGDKMLKRIARKRRGTTAQGAGASGRFDGGGYPTFSPEPVQPTLRFSDVGGMTAAKEAIRRYGILPAQNPELAERFGLEAGGALLLSGPPGCGKTLLAQAAAGEMGVPLFIVRIPDITYPLFGMSERNLANAFITARDSAPCVLFFDEVDALCQRRDDVMSPPAYRDVANVFLAEMDGVNRNTGVLVIGATNVPDLIDKALLRPGRFSTQIQVSQPDPTGRDAIWRIRAGKHAFAESVDIPRLVDLSEGLSGADIAQAAREAAEAVWVQCAEDGETRSVEMLDVLVALRRFVDGKTKRTIDELVSGDWSARLEGGVDG